MQHNQEYRIQSPTEWLNFAKKCGTTLEYVRFVYDRVLHEELEMALSLDTDSRGKTVFKEVETYFEKN